MAALRVIPLTLRQANEIVAQLHRHHKPVRGHRFSIGAVDDAGNLVGAAIVGRPVARAVDQYLVAEVTRLVTNGTPNACSLLYAAAARACQAMGFERIQTYILDSENGSSLKASGWSKAADVVGRDWNNGNKTGRRTDQPMCDKTRWERVLNEVHIFSHEAIA